MEPWYVRRAGLVFWLAIMLVVAIVLGVQHLFRHVPDSRPWILLIVALMTGLACLRIWILNRGGNNCV